MRICATGLAILMVLVATSTARADKKFIPRSIPLELMVSQADAIVTATVTHAANTPARSTSTLAKIKVDKIIAEKQKKTLLGQELTVTVNHIDTLAPIAGRQYLMMLSKSGDKYYTLPYLKAYSEDVAAATKELEKYANIENWTWGRESQGLRAIAVLRSARLTPAGDTATIQMSIALRNVSKEPVLVNLFRGDRTLSMKASWDGTPIATRAPAETTPSTYDPEANTLEIRPGELVWISHWGRSDDGTPFSLQAAGSEIQTQVTYSTSRESIVRGGKLWKGSVTTQEVTVKVEKP